MMKALRIYITAVKNNIASRMAYRADFFFSCFLIFISELLIPLVTLLIYGTGSSFPGWNLYEVLLLQGIFMLSKGVANLMFFGIVWNTLDRVREGSYDLILIKPGSSLFLTIASAFEIDSMGTILSSLATICYSLSKLPVPGAFNWLKCIFLFIMSLIVLFGFALIMAASVFKWVGNSRIYEIFDSITAFGNYPRSIFSKPFQAVITNVVPVAVIGFFPASALLGKPNDGILTASLASFVFLAAGVALWKYMLSKYTSAGG